jgi:hypothetical protein
MLRMSFVHSRFLSLSREQRDRWFSDTVAVNYVVDPTAIKSGRPYQ